MHATASRPSLAPSFRITSGCFWMRGAAGPCGGWHGWCLRLGHRSRASYLGFGRSCDRDDESGPIEAREPNRRFGRRHRRPLECVPLLASPRAAFQGPVRKSLVIMVREKVTSILFSRSSQVPTLRSATSRLFQRVASHTPGWPACPPPRNSLIRRGDLRITKQGETTLGYSHEQQHAAALVLVQGPIDWPRQRASVISMP